MKLTNPKIRLAFFFCMLIACVPASKLSAQSEATEQYIQQYQAIAEAEMARTGVPAAVSLAQGILESQSGQGWLVLHSHNHFGVKCKNNWAGPTIGYDDDRKNECFRVYQTDDSSWRDHSDFLKNTPRYAFLFYLNPADYKAWAMGLKSAGYATDKHYADRLIKTIETYHLEQYTDQVLARGKGKPQNDFAQMLNKKVDADRRALGVSPSPVVVETTASASSKDAMIYPAGVFRINGKQVVYLTAGTQLITVAEKHHIRLSRLVSFNDLKSDVLPESMLVYLQKKGKTGARPVHEVVAGETLEGIAQTEGIQLKWLRRFNGLSTDQAPVAGTKLYLKDYAPDGKVAKDSGKKKGFFARLFSGRKAAPVVSSTSGRTTAAPAPAQTGELIQPASQTSHPGMPAVADAVTQTTYEVKKGDTLYGISRKYDVPVATLRKWNHLAGDQIQVGQTLILKTNN